MAAGRSYLKSPPIFKGYMSLTLPVIICQHPLASQAQGLKIFLIDGSSQILDSNGRLPVGVGDGVAASLLANGWSVSSSS